MPSQGLQKTQDISKVVMLKQEKAISYERLPYSAWIIDNDGGVLHVVYNLSMEMLEYYYFLKTFAHIH